MRCSGDAGTPIIVTKGSEAGIYTPTAPLATGPEGVPLRKVGAFTATRTGTPGFLGLVGQALVTGGATSPDGKKAVLRTYSDAYEWDVPNGDVVAAIAKPPRITPLPGRFRADPWPYGRRTLTPALRQTCTRS